MCGISGIISRRGKIKQPFDILEMGTTLQHRGPDFKGHYISPFGNVIFSHRRLSLTGLDSRSTVITIPKRDNPSYEIATVFNGEIYNFKELKRYFVDKGYVSVSPSDFEVIPLAYQEWGEDCVDHLVGEFAFVLFDEEFGKVFLARDRTGVRPLFYTNTGDEFIFASEPKAILKNSDVPSEVDWESVAEYLLTSHAFAAGNQDNTKSFFKDIKQFPPSHFAFLVDNQLDLREYWDIPLSEMSSDGSVAKLRESLVASVRDRVPDELPVAVALSGGLDSSIIASLVTRYKEKKDVTAFCVQYVDNDNEDYRHAQIMSKYLGIDLKGPIVISQHMIDYVNRCIVANDGPVDSIRRIGMLANYEAMKEAGFKVALIGEGADEFNLGYYHKFPGLKLDQDVCSNESKLKDAFLNRAAYAQGFFHKGFLNQISFDSIVDNLVEKNYSKCLSDDPTVKMQYFYAKRFLQYLEDGNDRAAMASAIEARLPYVDPNLIETSIRIPFAENVSTDSEKIALRKAFASDLPEEVLERRKAPFPANKSIAASRMIANEFKRTISVVPDGIWEILNKDKFEKVSNDFNDLLDKIERDGTGQELLTSWLPLSEPVSLRTNQVFSLFTLLRWVDLYKLI